MNPMLKAIREHCKNLELLDIRDNFISDESVKSLCDLIKDLK